MRLLIFGLGYVGQALAGRLGPKGWSVAATCRGTPGPAFAALGVEPVAVDEAARHAALADAVLVTAAPDDHGCPGLAALRGGLSPGRGRWVGYLSSTGAYGDWSGRWVFEDCPLKAQSIEGARRAAAEHDWQAFGREAGLAVAAFRLPGIYGPGRSAFDRLRTGHSASVVRAGQVFSRVHVDDLARGLEASMARPRPGAAYNLCDDEPAPAHAVTAHAAALLGLPPPPTQAYDPDTVRPQARRFYAESKRVANALAKAELGWRPLFPTYREGLAAILSAEAAGD